ncbi:MAG: hypothetical protein BroJett031_37370 [Betaproteobacteria bacterium]|nr:MAG: hypothetical protein BroJett031_37370 [Betaproteobacteria bacterium]
MAEMVEDYHRRGYQIATHAIGDAAIEQVLSAYERALERWPAADRRHRIEHCGFTSDGQIARMAARGILPVPQSVFVYEFGDLYVDVLGEERAAGAYPMRRWWSAGLRPSGSSDAPVSDSHPLKNMYAAVTRTTVKGTVIGGQEALTLEEAVASQTHYSAFTTFAEDRKGLLAPGYLGDVTVVDRDIFAREPAELLEAKVDLTIVGGEVRHDRLGETG